MRAVQAFCAFFLVAGLIVLTGCKGDLNSNRECTPDCSGKECGTDDCGGVCGICGPGLACGDQDRCVASGCGNGRLDRNETCDSAITEGEGVCPLDCEDDGNSCTQENLFGTAEDCDVECRPFVIIECNNGDGCCPMGCDASSDTDCSQNCNNGVIDVEDGETCDPSDTCPTEADCNDNDACTTDVLTGSAASCSAQCANIAKTDDDCDLVTSDGCCPMGCNPGDDIDCTCGDGTVDAPGEVCDTGIDAGMPGACPMDAAADCGDNNGCTDDVIVGDIDACTAACDNPIVITACTNDDGCCPPICTPANDNDCVNNAVCDNGMIEMGEECDPIATCPTACDDMDACTTDTLMGDAQMCTAVCDFAPINAPAAGDGCCQPMWSVDDDADCQSVLDTYCQLAVANCGAATAPLYPDEATCLVDPDALAIASGMDGQTQDDTLYCRIGYLQTVDMMNIDTNCVWARADMSPMCNL